MKAELLITLTVTCDECNAMFDLLSEYGPNNHLNDDGRLLRRVLPANRIWLEAHDEFREHVVCPECEHETKVEGVEYV